MLVNTHSYYSLRYGTLAPENLLSMAATSGYVQVALTDINSTSACLDFVRLAPKYNIKPVLGVDFRNGALQQFVMLAENNIGFELINNYLSGLLHTATQVPNKAPVLANTKVIYPFTSYTGFPLADNEFIGITKEDLNKLAFSKLEIHKKKLLVLQTVSFSNKKGFNTHRLLRAIDNNSLLSKLPISEQALLTNTMPLRQDLEAAFSAYPMLLSTTKKLLAACTICFDFKSGKNQKSFTESEAEDYKMLKKLTYDGLPYRYGETISTKIHQRIDKELKIIKEKNFVSYFLINWEILRFARSKNFFYVGRGSGANSVVAYLLRITDVDPVELDLYFERFINLYRENPPDFDIDFSWRDRDTITQFIFKRFKNVALIAVYNTFKYKAAIREMGKVFGLPKAEIDKLSLGRYTYEHLDELSKLVVMYSGYIRGFPNYLGIHAGGILISEKPIHAYTATFMPPKGFASTQFDMLVAEEIGLYKFDILSQRGLGKIKEAVEIVAYNHPEIAPLDIHNIKAFKEDQRIKDLLKNAKAIGCFYVESPAMRMLLKKLQVQDYLGLVAASSVIRPGVAKSGMMREYILRYRFPNRRKEAHPVLLDIMPETFGVMVYQEDVIKVAHYFGGLTLGEADMLRRGMSGKSRSKDAFLKVKEQFFKNCATAGKEAELTQEIWRQIESFAGYAFAKGHSASYAVESYQSLYLKAYYPLEYMVATINNFGGFYSTELYVHEARMHGGIIEAPCVNKSFKQSVIYGKHIYLGFMFLHALTAKTMADIVTERKLGAFSSLYNFIDRLPISMDQIAILIKIDAFRFTGQNKRTLLWQAHMAVDKQRVEMPKIDLFKTAPKTFALPKLTSTLLENAFDEIELLGFPLCSPFSLLTTPLENNTEYVLPKNTKYGAGNKVSPHNYWKENKQYKGGKHTNEFKANNLAQYKGKIISINAYLVTLKRTNTTKGKPMFFGTFLDVEGYFIDTVHFPPIAKKYPFRGKGIYTINGKVVVEFDAVSIEVAKMERLAIVGDPRYAPS